MKTFSTYRQTMAEAYKEVNILENDLMGTLTDKQIANLKAQWANKSMRDVTPGVKATLKKMDMPTKVSIAQAKVNILKDIVFKEDAELDEGKVKSFLMDVEDDATKMDLNKFIRKHYGSMGLTADELKKMFYRVNNESVNEAIDDQADIEEGRMKDIFTANQEGESIEKIAKKLKLSIATVKDVLGEELLDEVADSITPMMLKVLKKEYEPFRNKKISAARAKQLMNILDKFNDKNLEILKKHNIPFVSSGAMSKLMVRKMKWKTTTINPFKEESQQNTFKEMVEGWGARKASGGYHGDKKFKKLKSEVEPKGDKEIEEGMPGGANSSSKKGSVWRKAMKAAMKRNYMRKAEHEPKGDELKEKFTVQITKKDGGQIVHGSYKTKPEADKFIRWYKTGPMKDVKSVEVIKEMAKDDAHAIGMAAAKKHTGDTEAPLEKSTIKKGHEIADKILNKEAVGHYQKLMLTYGKPGGDAKVYYTDYMQDLQNRAQEYRKKGFIIGKMGRSVPMNQLPKKMPMKGKEIKTERLWLKHKRGDKK